MNQQDQTYDPTLAGFTPLGDHQSGFYPATNENENWQNWPATETAITPATDLHESTTAESSLVQPTRITYPSHRHSSSDTSELDWPASFFNIEYQSPSAASNAPQSLIETQRIAAMSNALLSANAPSAQSQVASIPSRLPRSSGLTTATRPDTTTSSRLPRIQESANTSSPRLAYLNFATTQVDGAGHIVLAKRNLLEGIRGIAVDINKIRSIHALNSFITSYFRQTIDKYGLSLHYISGYAGNFYSHTQGSYYYYLGPASTQESWTKIYSHLAGRCMRQNHCAILKCSYCKNPPIIFACFDGTALTNTLLDKGMDLSTKLQFVDGVRLPISTRPVIPEVVGAGTNHRPTAATVLKRSAPLDADDAPASKKSRVGSSSESKAQDTEDTERDWSRATPNPSGNTKALTDTCLTCIQYKGKCRGTTIDDDGKCLNCQGHGDEKKTKRKCFWQNKPEGVITYHQARKKNGNCWEIPQNRRDAVALRTQSRSRSTTTPQSFTSDTTSLTYRSIMGDSEEALNSIDQDAFSRALDAYTDGTRTLDPELANDQVRSNNETSEENTSEFNETNESI